MEENIQKEVNKLRNLPQYKNKDDSFLEEKARKNLQKKEIDISSKFKDKDDKKEANRLLEFYLEALPNPNPLQRQLIDDLIVHQVNKSYLIKTIEEKKKKKAGEEHNVIPNALLTQLREIEEHILELHEKLGFNKDTETGDELTGFEIYRKKAIKYINSNREEFTSWIPWQCEKCNHKTVKGYLLWKKVKDFDAIEHPWFIYRTFYNHTLFQFIKQGKITKEEAWQIMCDSMKGNNTEIAKKNKEWCIDYINWCLENEAKITESIKNSTEI